MAHLKMDKFGNVFEVGFDGQMGADAINPQILAAYNQPVNLPSTEQGGVANPTIVTQSVAAPAAVKASAINPSPAVSTTGLIGWLKGFLAPTEAAAVPQTALNVKSTTQISTAPTEYTIATEKIGTKTEEIAPQGQTVLPPSGTVAKVSPKSDRALKVAAILEARKAGKVAAKTLSTDEKSLIMRHPFLDVFKK
jgi:hypothetical protein